MVLKVSVLITTFNRRELLPDAIASVLKQNFRDFELVIVDDASIDPVDDLIAGFGDDRIRLIRNRHNVGGSGGDIAIVRKFIAEECRGDLFVYLCDDDFWIPSDLLGRQVGAFKDYDDLVMVQGGMAQWFEAPLAELVPNVSYLTYRFLDEERTQTFGAGLYPSHVMDGKDFLRLFADDPKNRNIIGGATLINVEKFRKVGALDRAAGVRWQAGYALHAGAATAGAVLYLDEPCVMTRMSSQSASFRGSQKTHLIDALSSIAAAFAKVEEDPDCAAIRNTMAANVMMIYLANKVAHSFGWFRASPTGDILDHFKPPITGDEFLDIAAQRRVCLSEQQIAAVRWSDGNIRKDDWPRFLRMIGA